MNIRGSGNSTKSRTVAFGTAVLICMLFVPAIPGRAAGPLPADSYVEVPSSGKGPLAILFSGGDGHGPYVGEAKAYAKEGYFVVLFDSTLIYTYTESASETANSVRSLIQRSLKKPEVQSSKAAVIGYSRGGLLALTFANRMADLVTSVVAYYPSTQMMGDPKEFLSNPRLNVPTLVLAGTNDTFMDCCLIGRARALKAAASLPDINVPLEIYEYPNANHVFNISTYPKAYRQDYAEDAFRRSLGHIQKYSDKLTDKSGNLPEKSSEQK